MNKEQKQLANYYLLVFFAVIVIVCVSALTLIIFF